MNDFPKNKSKKINNLKLPPQSDDAERSVLGGLMLVGEAWDKVADLLSEEDFYRNDHSLIFKAIRALSEENKPCDVITVGEWLNLHQLLEDAGDEDYLIEIASNVPGAANIKAYAEIVREKSVLRQLIQIGNQLTEKAFNPEGKNSDDLLEEAEKDVFGIREQTLKTKSGFQDIKTLLRQVIVNIEEMSTSDGAMTGIPTGFTDFDKKTNGLQTSDLIIVAGRPAMGKTSFAVNIAEKVAIKEGKSVAIFSMEMSSVQLAMRMMASLSRINSSRLKSGQLQDEEWPRIVQVNHLLSNSKIFIDDTPALSPLEVRARCRRLQRQHGLDLVVIDYLQLMQVKGSENRVNEISEISRSLKGLAKELDIPVIALSQLNRSLEQRPNKRPVMSDLRECVTGDTKVVLSDGSRIPIKDLVGTKPELFALNQKDKITVAQSDKVWKVGQKKVYKLHLASGRSIKATAEHRFKVDLSWKKVKDIQIGNRLALANHIPEPNKNKKKHDFSDLKLALLGQMIGDGSYLKGQPLRYTSNNTDNSNIVKLAAQKEFGLAVNRHEYKDKTWHQLVFSGNGNRWHPAGMNKWLRDLNIFNQRSHEKIIPAAVFNLSNRQIALLLKHLWATDGTIYTRAAHNKGSHMIQYATNSPQLAKDVAFLLLRLGIVSRTKKTQKQDFKPSYHICITGAAMQRHFLKQVGAFGPRLKQAIELKKALNEVKENPNVDTLPIEIFKVVKQSMLANGISQRKMAAMRGTSYGGTSHFRFAPSKTTIKSYAKLLNNNELKQHADNDIFWDKVVLIEECGTEDVYDLTVPKYENWLADGIISHNSGAIEQDADLIVFIYRDEVYNEDSMHKGKAEIILGKHRHGSTGMIPLTFLGEFTKFENFLNDIGIEDSIPPNTH